jgi:CheY-like chemotaxis protein
VGQADNPMVTGDPPSLRAYDGVPVRLRAHPAGEELDVVFLTAGVQRAEVARLQHLGVRGVLAEPFDPTTLADQLRALLADRQEPS